MLESVRPIDLGTVKFDVFFLEIRNLEYLKL